MINRYVGGTVIFSLDAALVLVTTTLDRIFLGSEIAWNEIGGRFEYIFGHGNNFKNMGASGDDSVARIYPEGWDNVSEIRCRMLCADTGFWRVEEGSLIRKHAPNLKRLHFTLQSGLIPYIKPVKVGAAPSATVQRAFKRYRSNLRKEATKLLGIRRKPLAK